MSGLGLRWSAQPSEAQAERKVARVGLMTFFSTVYSSCREELYCITGHE
jgi:hypothetical protein